MLSLEAPGEGPSCLPGDPWLEGHIPLSASARGFLYASLSFIL